jgi:hypothetical protein
MSRESVGAPARASSRSSTRDESACDLDPTSDARRPPTAHAHLSQETRLNETEGTAELKETQYGSLRRIRAERKRCPLARHRPLGGHHCLLDEQIRLATDLSTVFPGMGRLNHPARRSGRELAASPRRRMLTSPPGQPPANGRRPELRSAGCPLLVCRRASRQRSAAASQLSDAEGEVDSCPGAGVEAAGGSSEGRLTSAHRRRLHGQETA